MWFVVPDGLLVEPPLLSDVGKPEGSKAELAAVSEPLLPTVALLPSTVVLSAVVRLSSAITLLCSGSDVSVDCMSADVLATVEHTIPDGIERPA